MSDDLGRAFRALESGDRAALAEVYDVCAAELFGLALWLTRSRADASDVVQEVFVRLASTRARLTGVRSPRAYLLTMTRRAASDIVKRRGVNVDVTDALLEPVESDEASRIDAARTAKLVESLPFAQRDVVFLRERSSS